MKKYSKFKEQAIQLYNELPKEKSITKIAKQIAKELDFEYDDSFRRTLSNWIEVDSDLENTTKTETNQYFITKELSAKKLDGKIMDIDEYCLTYGIPREHVRSYKLITHGGKEAYYNIASANLDEQPEGFDIIAKVEDLINSYTPNQVSYLTTPPEVNTKILQLFISDCHIGMTTNHDNFSLYGGKWSKEDLMERKRVILEALDVATRGGVGCIQVINLGDLADGLDGQTVRKGHELPQNMSNEEVFDISVQLLTDIMNYVVVNINPTHFIWYNVCNSNHSSSFDYFIAQAVKGIASVAYPKVQVINERKFIGHFHYGKHTEIITHGKDDKNLKFGFKAQLDQKGKEKIAEYIRFHNLHQDGQYISFHKGDSHQQVTDKSESYDYNSYLALSPSSSWVQTNFRSGRSGFSIIVKTTDNYSQLRYDYEFEWGTNKLK